MKAKRRGPYPFTTRTTIPQPGAPVVNSTTEQRERSPFSLWRAQSGRETLANRYHAAIWIREPGHPAQPSAGPHPPEGELVGYLFTEADAPWRNPRTRTRLDRALGKFVAGESIDDAVLPKQQRRPVLTLRKKSVEVETIE